jgi:hypothetical protein
MIKKCTAEIPISEASPHSCRVVAHLFRISRDRVGTDTIFITVLVKKFQLICANVNIRKEIYVTNSLLAGIVQKFVGKVTLLLRL